VTLHRIEVLAGLAQLTLGDGGLGHERADAGVLRFVREVLELLVHHAELFVQVLQTAAHLDETPLDELASHSAVVYGPVLPRRSRFLALCVAIVPTLAACGGGSSSASCDQPVREELDPASLTHVIAADDARFRTNPPTSGPHVGTAAPTGALTESIPGAVQVAILEAGNVLVQYSPDLDAGGVEELRGLVADTVVVAPNAELPAPVVATAWTYKLSCEAVDLDAVGDFIDDHAGAVLGH
jgi:hypothetical protein